MSLLTSEGSSPVHCGPWGSHQPLGAHLCLHLSVHLGSGSLMSLKGEYLELLVQADMNNEHGEYNFGLWLGLIERTHTLKILPDWIV